MDSTSIMGYILVISIGLPFLLTFFVIIINAFKAKPKPGIYNFSSNSSPVVIVLKQDQQRYISPYDSFVDLQRRHQMMDQVQRDHEMRERYLYPTQKD